MIFPEDVEIAARHLNKDLFDLSKDPVPPRPCKACGQFYDHLIDWRFGYICPHCLHMVCSMSAAYNEGDPIPEDEEKIIGGK